ncbi:ankyrin repeat domain-containing protein [Aquabacterium sp. A7-Y]|uniref:ankyrin repeat domain-containing protein n=1 Tax=Aquabacterium sp. A7-Y TaxID=1349605 RepID=UPI00223DA48A|nr:ankyrin repeat domain-containing protein [Aquabacterium sp. A7-Y]MCW7540613.1 ankyrin repeat domain-containing protein [Aquabacterium sp. A7-Y]
MKRFLKNVLQVVLATGVSCAAAGSYEDYFQAIKRNDARSIVRLLNRGFDPNTVDPEGRVGLLLALQEPSPKVAEALLSHPGIDVNRLNGVGESPLMMAALKGELAWCERLIAHDADVNKPGWTPLHYAASGGKVPVIALLLEHHAFIDAQSPNHTTPLMMAARYGTEEAARALLDAGADPTMRNEKGLSAADFARSVGREELARVIEAHERTYNTGSRDTATPSGAK